MVLSMFMLALLTMIGMASMMTSTTEVDIAANEKFHKIAFYDAEAGLVIGAEIILQHQAYEVVATDASNRFIDSSDKTTEIEVNDDQFLFEPKESKTIVSGSAEPDEYDVRVDTASFWDRHDQSDYAETSPDLTYANAIVDIDKVAVKHIAGGGAEFGTGGQGIGVASNRVIYNIDAIGGARIKANHIMGFQFIPK